MHKPNGWVGYPEQDTDGVLPPDLLPNQPEPYCGEVAQIQEAYTCTRLPGHTGRHAASNGELIVAVWS